MQSKRREISRKKTKDSKHKKLLLVDLDDTLVNTSEFKELLFNFLSKELLISKRKVKYEYYALRKRTGLMDSWIDEYISKLIKMSEADKEKLLYTIIEIVRETPLIDEVVHYCQGSQRYRIIFTQGERKLQLAKADLPGLKKCFDDLIIIEGDKVKFLEGRVEQDKLNLKGKCFDDVEIIDNNPGSYSRLRRHLWIKVKDTIPINL